MLNKLTCLVCKGPCEIVKVDESFGYCGGTERVVYLGSSCCGADVLNDGELLESTELLDAYYDYYYEGEPI